MADKQSRAAKQFYKALQRLQEVLQHSSEQDSIIIDATIQRFEFTIELCWKAMKVRLYEEGIQATTPRSVLQEAFTVGWFDNETIWLRMLHDRNLTSHTYNEEQALEIYRRIPSYAVEMQELYDRLFE